VVDGGFALTTLVDLLSFAGLEAHAADDLPPLVKILTDHRARFADALAELEMSSVELVPPFDPRWE
jgi:hypothetical protein